MSGQNSNPLRFFVSYAHEDESYKDELQKHLSSLIRNGSISSWDDRQIPIGGEWDRQIKSEMNNADVILLLISADFLDSSYCNDVEVKRAMERHNSSDDPAVVVPIILRYCDWTDTDFAKLQALPKNAEPIASFDDKDEAYVYIVKQIKNLIRSRNQPKQSASTTTTSTTSTPVDTPPVTSTPVSPVETSPAPAATGMSLDEIRNLIGQNKTEKAIKAMMEIAKEKDDDIYNALIMQSGRLNNAQKNAMMGVATPSDTNRTIAQVNYALLELLKDL